MYIPFVLLRFTFYSLINSFHFLIFLHVCTRHLPCFFIYFFFICLRCAWFLFSSFFSVFRFLLQLYEALFCFLNKLPDCFPTPWLPVQQFPPFLHIRRLHFPVSLPFYLHPLRNTHIFIHKFLHFCRTCRKYISLSQWIYRPIIYASSFIHNNVFSLCPLSPTLHKTFS